MVGVVPPPGEVGGAPLNEATAQVFGAWKDEGVAREAVPGEPHGALASMFGHPTWGLRAGALEGVVDAATAAQRAEELAHAFARGRDAAAASGALGGGGEGARRAFDAGLAECLEVKKTRIILNLKDTVNVEATEWDYTYSPFADFVAAIPPGGYMGKKDVAGGFNGVRMAPGSQRYLYVRVEGKTFVWCRLPMGWSLSPGFFSLFSAEVAAGVRARLLALGVDCIVYVYLDDFLLGAATREACQRGMDVLGEVFTAVGMVEAPGKTEGPVQKMVMMGLEYDSVSRVLSCPIDKLVKTLTFTAIARTCALRKWPVPGGFGASLAGRISHLAEVDVVLRPYTCALGRLLFGKKQDRRLHYLHVSAMAPVLAALQFVWDRAAGGKLARSRLVHPGNRPRVFVTSDATRREVPGGHVGAVAFTVGDVTLRFASAALGAYDIGILELLAPALFVSRFGYLFPGAHLVFGLDNAGEQYHLNSGRSSCPFTVDLLRVIFSAGERVGFTHHAGWLPREANHLNDRCCAATEAEARALCPGLHVPALPADMWGLLQAWAPEAGWDPAVWKV